MSYDITENTKCKDRIREDGYCKKNQRDYLTGSPYVNFYSNDFTIVSARDSREAS